MKLKILFVLLTLILSILALPMSLKATAQVGSFLSVPLQPFTDQVQRLQSAMNFLGQPLGLKDQAQIKAAPVGRNANAAVSSIAAILDKYVLAVVTISPESRVDVKLGEASPSLVQNGTRAFLIKVVNQAGITARLAVESPNSGLSHISSKEGAGPNPRLKAADIRQHWADIVLFTKPPMEERLSGLPLEYRILLVSSRDAGQRSCRLSFNVGQGTQDVGFLNEISVLFKIAPSHAAIHHALDRERIPTMAFLVVRDSLGRIHPNPAQLGPDFYFQSQVYPADCESIDFRPGDYTVPSTGSQEYIKQTRTFSISSKETAAFALRLQRWIEPSKQGWYSEDNDIRYRTIKYLEADSDEA